MIAFAANSILCRLALADGDCDAATFTLVRVASGAAMLAAVSALRKRGSGWSAGRWDTGFFLALYAVGFSYAYLELDVSIGTLIAFALVQATMITGALIGGERPRPIAWLGIAVAAGGTVYLFMPGLTAPSATGAVLMGLAGFGWGLYSLRAKGVSDAIGATSGNFLRATLLVLPFIVIWIPQKPPTLQGWVAALVSGVVTSGLGYVIWYTVVPRLGPTRAAIVQLTAPVIAATGGVALLGETVTLRLAVSSAAILGGVALVLSGRSVAKG